MWNRSYVHLFDQRNVFSSKTVLADPEYADVIFLDQDFAPGGEMVAKASTLQAALDDKFEGKISNLFATMLSSKNDKWALALTHHDYYRVLACYLKEIQHTYKLTDSDLHTLAFTYMYDNFYYSNDTLFRSGFSNNAYRDVMVASFADYSPTGVLDLLSPNELPSEIGYFLVGLGLIDEMDIWDSYVNAAKLVIRRLWDIHQNDSSEWLILDTKIFLNMMKADETPAVESDDFTLEEMMAYINGDRYLSAMFNQPFDFHGSASNWSDVPNFNDTASRLVASWERLAQYLVDRGLDAEWAKIRHSQYEETKLRYDYVMNTCTAVRYLLKLDNAPEKLDRPIRELLGYDIVSECMGRKYNTTLLLFALRGASPTFKKFITTAFGDI